MPSAPRPKTGHRTPHDGGADDGPLSSLPESLRLPPEGNVDPRIEDKIRQAVSRLRAGKTSFNSALRNNKIYRNPDLLTWLVGGAAAAAAAVAAGLGGMSG
eukprot:365981-Chlamydomonas_euryale.AAC.24